MAYVFLSQTTWPSWLYSVTQGATTIRERWDGWTHDNGFQDPKMNSFNHNAFGAVGAWMYAVIGGIDLDSDKPGYQHVVMHPRVGGGLTCANAAATIYIPAKDLQHVMENERPAENANGVTFLYMENGCAVCNLSSGTYHFTSQQE